MNQWNAIGRMVADPEAKYTPSGKAVTGFRLAVDDGKKGDEKQTLFATVVCWERLAEAVANYGSKGRLCGVTGRWTQRSYEAQDGTKRTVYEVVAQSVQFLDKPKDAGGNAGSEPNFTDDDDVPF